MCPAVSGTVNEVHPRRGMMMHQKSISKLYVYSVLLFSTSQDRMDPTAIEPQLFAWG